MTTLQKKDFLTADEGESETEFELDQSHLNGSARSTPHQGDRHAQFLNSVVGRLDNKTVAGIVTNREKNVFRSCCFSMDRRGATFFAQLIISLLLISFCVAQLFLFPPTPESDNPWSTLLSAIVFFWLPSPKFGNNP